MRENRRIASAVALRSILIDYDYHQAYTDEVLNLLAFG